ncbi:DMT family transporter [Nocardia bovistercoris]|uniref:DMT family transporter n=1 Tax=Nocardia bovistercoris TaxID=2785916 RepID=A0A931I652_9NOCA|nr:DMT family transporter [Nocardia bovistercoris]MBH0775587.1 DMT family transporter [Nocardia bovistercoris]
MKDLDRPAFLAAAVTVVLWASAFVFIRSAGTDFSPGALALGRLLTASIALVIILRISGEGLPTRAAWRGIAISGVLWFGVYMVALNWGERYIDAGTAAMVINIGPVLIALLGGLVLGEGFPARLMAGMAVSFAGAIVVGVSNSGDEGHAAVGVLLCLTAAATWAISTVAQKPALRHASALQVTTGGCVIGAVACLPFTGQLVRELAHAPVTSTLSVLYLGVFPTAVAFTTWAYALARTTAGKMGVTTYAVPALVVAMAWLALGETPSPLAIVGGLLCLSGVAVSRSGGARRTVTARAR